MFEVAGPLRPIHAYYKCDQAGGQCTANALGLRTHRRCKPNGACDVLVSGQNHLSALLRVAQINFGVVYQCLADPGSTEVVDVVRKSDGLKALVTSTVSPIHFVSTPEHLASGGERCGLPAAVVLTAYRRPDSTRTSGPLPGRGLDNGVENRRPWRNYAPGEP